MCFSTISAQEIVPLTRTALDSLMNPMLLDGGKNILEFKRTEQSVGLLQESDSSACVAYDFICKKETSITRVQTFCGCTVADYQKQSFKKGDKGRIMVSYSPKNHPGTINEKIFVYTADSEKYPIARLVLRGEVIESVDKWDYLPYEIGNIRLKRREIHLNEIRQGAPAIERILCANTGDTSLKLEAIGLPECISLRMEPETLEPGQEGDIVIAVKKENSSLRNGERISFTIKEAGSSSKGGLMTIIIENIIKE